MKIEDFSKTKEELEEQKKQNDGQIYVSDERTRMAKVNQFECKAYTTLMFSMIGYLPLFLASGILVNSLGASAITSIFPGFSFPIALVGGSLGIGAIAKTLMYKKIKLKERLEAFSTAKTQADKLEEEIQYQIELEKANNRNKAIDQTLAVLNSNESLLRTISSRYDINNRNTPQTEEETKRKIEELSTLLKEKYDELDLTTTKKVLHDRFWRIRVKSQKNIDIMIASIFSSLFTELFFMFPIMLVSDAIAANSMFLSSGGAFVPFIAGAVGASGYIAKRNRDHKKVFNNLNSKLGVNALEDEINYVYNEQQELTSLIEGITRDISLAEVQLKEQQRALEAIKLEAAEKRDKDDPWRNVHLTTDVIRKSLQAEPLTATELIFGQSEISDETQYDRAQESGPTLVRRRKPTNPNDQKK